MHPLDNVIWNALATRQAELAECCGTARRFPTEITSLSGFEQENDAGYESLAGLLGSGGVSSIFLDHPFQPRPGWELLDPSPLLQMVYDERQPSQSLQDSSESPHIFVRLSASDSGDMLELANLTRPGPFGSRTHELGNFLGIRTNGKLVAMAGERLKVPGHTEVSGVCTHPDHTGKGYAGALMREVMCGILSRGETPFLHVRANNTRAISLYEHLGFRVRTRSYRALLRKL